MSNKRVSEMTDDEIRAMAGVNVNPMSNRLRSCYEYATTHQVADLTVMLDAAAEIERLEQKIADMRWYMQVNGLD